MKYFKTFEQFSLNEAKVRLKRKYTENSPAVHVSDYAPMRTAILKFVKENGTVSHAKLKSYIRKVRLNAGKNPGHDWIGKNAHKFFNIKDTDEGKIYSLNRNGNRFLDHKQLNESELQEVDD